MTMIDWTYAVLVMVILEVAIRRRMSGGYPARFLFFSAFLLVLISWPPAVWLAGQTLEGWYDKTPPAAQEAGAIVVLGGWVAPRQPGRPEPLIWRDTYRRCRYAVWYYKNQAELPVLVCGGKTKWGDVIADEMRELLVEAGLHDRKIWVEASSGTTHENALNAAKRLGKEEVKEIVLVTDADHMLRAERAFRRQGIEVIPAPCDLNLGPVGLADLLPSVGAVQRSSRIVYEWIGLVWYYFRGHA